MIADSNNVSVHAIKRLWEFVTDLQYRGVELDDETDCALNEIGAWLYPHETAGKEVKRTRK
jgi:hypothetical protein